jgi:hypothetical protein
VLDSSDIVAGLEGGVALLAGSLGLGGVNVSGTVVGDLGLLSLAELVEDVGGTVLGKRLLVELDSVLEVALLDVGVTNTSIGLGDGLVVGTELTAFLDGLLSSLNALGVVALLKVDG